MKVNKPLIYTAACMLLLAAACTESHKPANTAINAVVSAQPYSITEDFESGTKAHYDVADVTTATGTWTLDGAVLNADINDVKDGKKSVRLQGTPGNAARNGMLTMGFDVKHLHTFSFKAALAKFADKARGDKATLKGSVEVQLSTDGGQTFNKIGQTIYCDTAFTTSTFTITDSVARFRIVNTSDLNGNNRVRVNIDDVVFSGSGDPGFATVTTATAATAESDEAPVTTAGSRPLVVGTDAPPASGDNSNMLLGNPSGAQANTASRDNYLIDMGYYAESYNATRGTPNWVSWHLDQSNTTNRSARLNDFAAWSGLPDCFYAVQSSSYSGSGFDKGHNCPSADRSSSANANAATFLMTNMIPQAPQNNEHTWGGFEAYLRQQTVHGNEVYIIMGSYGMGGTGSKGLANTINKGHVTVPSNIWKVAVIITAGNNDIGRVNAATRVIAVNTPNINTISPDWTRYIVTVRSIEQATGYNLLSALPQNVQDAVEGKKDAGL